MKSYIGTEAKEGDIPADLKDQVTSYREKLIEAAAESNDALLEKYLGGEELSMEELVTSLKQGVLTGKVIPILAGSATKNIGMKQLMDAVKDYLPSPAERDVIVLDKEGNETSVKAGESEPLAVLVFKTSADPYVGKLTYFRVFNGVLTSNSQIYNVNKGEHERIGQLFMLRGKTQETVTKIVAGDIGGVAKLNVTNTGDTLCAQDKPVKLPPIVYPNPVFSQAVYPKKKPDHDKLGSALTRLV
jgi:elongation factor G